MDGPPPDATTSPDEPGGGSITRAQARLIDAQAVERFGVPSIVLMENAGRQAADEAERLLGAAPASAVSGRGAVIDVVCGGGNNGGDGYVVARHMALRGWSVRVWAARAIEELEGDAAVNGRIVQRMGLAVTRLTAASLGDAAKAWREAALIVDGLLGSGFRPPMRGEAAAIIERINLARDAGAMVLALDLPSGLDADDGEPARPTVRAHRTVTFVAPKRGMTQPASRAWIGEVVVADIGAPLPWDERFVDPPADDSARE